MMEDWGKEHARALKRIQLCLAPAPVYEHSLSEVQADAI